LVVSSGACCMHMLAFIELVGLELVSKLTSLKPVAWNNSRVTVSVAALTVTYSIITVLITFFQK
jgi:hypothetical protein